VITILHTADWQIGKLFGEFPNDSGALLRAQRIETVRSLAEIARNRQVDAVLVAGDVFETNTVSDETIRRTVNAMSGYGGPWLLLPGNHDPALAESVWTRLPRLDAPGNIIPLTTSDPVLLAEGRLAVLPAPLMRRHDIRDLTESFDIVETPVGVVRVGLAHGSVANRLPERSEAINIISDDRARAARLDYLALGDWHGTLEIAERTWYSGTPEPDRFRRNDPGNALLVQLTGPGTSPRVERLVVGHFRWVSLEGGISSITDIETLEARLEGLDEPHERNVVALALAGTVDFETRHRLIQTLDRWRAQFFHLRVDDSRLVAEATEDDLDRIDSMGFVRAAINIMKRAQADPTNPDCEIARSALQTLYLEHIETGAA
jgi:DNA repair exonuclease SbcCD nuclease subunit